MTSKKDNAMNRIQNLWTRLTTPFANDPDEALREYMTRVILLMQGIALTVFTIPIVVGWITGAFPLEAVIIMLSLLVPIIAGFWWAYHRRWQIAKYIPPILFFALGLYLSCIIPLGMTPLLFFILAVMLTSLLQGVRVYWLVVGLSLTAYVAIGVGLSQESIQIIIVGGTFTGIVLLQWFSISQFQRAILKAYKHREELDDANQKLRENEARLSKAQEVAKIGSWEMNIITGKAVWSDETYRLFGLEPQEFEITYENFKEFLHPDDREIVLEEVEEAMMNKDSYEDEYRIVRKDNKVTSLQSIAEIEHDERGNPVLIRGTIQDVTNRKRAEEELENTFNLSPDMVGVFTTEGKLLKVNPSWEKVLGYTIKELLGMGWTKLVHPDDVEQTNKEVEKQLKGSAVVNFVNRFKCKDGSYKTLEWQATFAKEGIVHI